MSGLKYRYTHEKLSLAIGAMAASSEKLTRRILRAYRGYLFVLQERDFPPELQGKFKKIIDAISEKTPPPYYENGTVEWTLMYMHALKAKKIIEQLAEIQFSLVHVYQD